MDIVTFTHRFFEMERRLALFGEQAQGVYWWDAVRFQVFYGVYDRLAGIVRPALPVPSLGVRLRNYAVRLTRRFAFEVRTRLSTYDVIVFRAARKQVGGRMVDEAMDPVSELVQGRCLVIDTYPHYFHRRERAPLVRLVDPRVMTRLEDAVLRDFGIRGELEGAIERIVADYLAQIDYYGALLERTRARLVLLTQNGIEKGLIVAAREAGVPIVEVQHGLIAMHPGYSYPEGIDYSHLRSLPTCLFTYSDFWSRCTHMPNIRKRAIGRFDHAGPAGGDAAAAIDLLVISADKYDLILRPIVRAIARAHPQKAIAYKLHPKQTPSEGEIRADLAGCGNVQVIPASRPMSPLLAAAPRLLTVQSTVVYEALQQGKHVWLAAHGEHLVHSDVLDLPQVHVFDIGEAPAVFGPVPQATGEPPVFFEPFSAARVRAALAELWAG